MYTFQRGSVSVCEVTYSDKAPGGGVAATAPWQWTRHTGRGEHEGASLSKSPASFNKASVIPCLKRPPFLLLSPPLSLSKLNAGKSTSLPKPCREINAGRRGEGGGNVERRLRTSQCHWTVTWAKTSRGTSLLSTVLSLDSDEGSSAKEYRQLWSLMPMKTWQIILWSQMKGELQLLWLKPLLASTFFDCWE